MTTTTTKANQTSRMSSITRTRSFILLLAKFAISGINTINLFCIIDRTENYIHTLMHDFMHLLCISYVVARCNLRCRQSQHKKFQSIGSRTSTMSQLRKHMIVFHQDQVGITAKVKTQKIDQIQA